MTYLEARNLIESCEDYLSRLPGQTHSVHAKVGALTSLLSSALSGDVDVVETILRKNAALAESVDLGGELDTAADDCDCGCIDVLEPCDIPSGVVMLDETSLEDGGF